MFGVVETQMALLMVWTVVVSVCPCSSWVSEGLEDEMMRDTVGDRPAHLYMIHGTSG
jgi:hypothetical protein